MESKNEGQYFCVKCSNPVDELAVWLTESYVICKDCRTERFRVKQLTYGFNLGQWIVVDGLTVALDPVKKSDRSMWTGSEDAARHYARELNLQHARPPQPVSRSQAYRIFGPNREEDKRLKRIAGNIAKFVRCDCGRMYKEGTEHTCKV